MLNLQLVLTCCAVVFATLAITPSDSLAICRVVNDPEDPPPQIKPDQSVLFLKRTNIEVGDCDKDGDAGPVDAGANDGGGEPDGGVDADGGPGDDGDDRVEPQECQLIPEAITMVVQPEFRVGEDGSSFALLMVTPSQPVITLESKTLFSELEERTGPIVDVVPVYIEDAALGYQCKDPSFSRGSGCGPASSSGGKSDFEPPEPPEWMDPEVDAVESVGPYDVARLSATDSNELATSLTELGYDYSQADLDAIAPYLDLGYVAVAVRVRVDGSLSGGLQPLSLTYPGTEMRLPLGISRQPELAETSIALYVSADARYDFPGAEVTYAQLQSDVETVLTRSNMLVLLESGPEGDPAAAPSQNNEPVRQRVTVDQEIRIPSSQCPNQPAQDAGGDLDLCGCRQSSLRGSGNAAVIALSILLLGALARRRRRD